MNLLPWSPDRPEPTKVVHDLTQAAFAPYRALARPSGALAESLDDVATDLAAGGASSPTTSTGRRRPAPCGGGWSPTTSG